MLSSPPGFRYEFDSTSLATAYGNITQQVWSIMTVLMPQANNSYQTSMNEGEAYMTCICAKNLPENSRTPAALPTATPTRLVGNLSAGGKARIAIEATLGALLLAGVALWARRLQREKKFGTRARNANDREDTTDKGYKGTGMDVLGAESTWPSRLHGNKLPLGLSSVGPVQELDRTMCATEAIRAGDL